MVVWDLYLIKYLSEFNNFGIIRGLIIRRDMHLCKRLVWENAYSGFKSMERPINLYIILFDNHFPFQKSVFCHSKYILGDVLDNYVKKSEKNFFAKKCIFAQKCVYSFLPFNFVIWQVACGHIYSLKDIWLTYFRSIP